MNPTIAYITDVLSTNFDIGEAREMAYWIAEEITGKQRTELLLMQSPIEISNLHDYLQRLLSDEPVQYIFGHCLWLGLDLKVSPATLIPRPETAELVEWIKNEENNEKKTVLDIGTGSGCIALALKQHFSQWQLSACDISEEALAIANTNAEKYQQSIRFFTHDILTPLSKKYDIVVSNPPYITNAEKKSMRSNVLDFEPHSALFVSDNDPLLFYRSIAKQHIAECLYFEINERFGNEMTRMLLSEGYNNVMIKQDSYGKERMVCARVVK